MSSAPYAHEIEGLPERPDLQLSPSADVLGNDLHEVPAVPVPSADDMGLSPGERAKYLDLDTAPLSRDERHVLELWQSGQTQPAIGREIGAGKGNTAYIIRKVITRYDIERGAIPDPSTRPAWELEPGELVIDHAMARRIGETIVNTEISDTELRERNKSGRTWGWTADELRLGYQYLQQAIRLVPGHERTNLDTTHMQRARRLGFMPGANLYYERFPANRYSIGEVVGDVMEELPQAGSVEQLLAEARALPTGENGRLGEPQLRAGYESGDFSMPPTNLTYHFGTFGHFLELAGVISFKDIKTDKEAARQKALDWAIALYDQNPPPDEDHQQMWISGKAILVLASAAGKGPSTVTIKTLWGSPDDLTGIRKFNAAAQKAYARCLAYEERDDRDQRIITERLLERDRLFVELIRPVAVIPHDVLRASGIYRLIKNQRPEFLQEKSKDELAHVLGNFSPNDACMWLAEGRRDLNMWDVREAAKTAGVYRLLFTRRFYDIDLSLPDVKHRPIKKENTATPRAQAEETQPKQVQPKPAKPVTQNRPKPQRKVIVVRDPVKAEPVQPTKSEELTPKQKERLARRRGERQRRLGILASLEEVETTPDGTPLTVAGAMRSIILHSDLEHVKDAPVAERTINWETAQTKADDVIEALEGSGHPLDEFEQEVLLYAGGLHRFTPHAIATQMYESPEAVQNTLARLEQLGAIRKITGRGEYTEYAVARVLKGA